MQNAIWNKYYPIQVWLSTLFIAPAFYLLLSSNYSGNIATGLQIVLAFFFFGLLFSAPTFVIYSLLFRYMLRDNLSAQATKIFSSLTAICGLVITIYCVDDPISWKSLDFVFIKAYALTILFFSFIFKIKRKSKQSM